MLKNKYFLSAIIGLLFFLACLIIFKKNNLSVVVNINKQVAVDTTKATSPAEAPVVPENKVAITGPIRDARSRVSKKFFRTKVSPQDSPISPERFSGYHTGVDFETTVAEKDTAVQIYTVCAGPLLSIRWVSGYGGAVVQACQINKEEVTVVYGHLKLDSISNKLNDVLTAGQPLGILGQGYSTEIDGERKHLHLSIHRGAEINLRGYVSRQSDLAEWIDALTLVQ